MGKKKVSKQKEAELIKETSDIEQASKKASVGQTANRLTKSGKVYIQATYNNTIISVTDNSGGVMAWSSAGAMGFKGAKKATPYAAQIITKIASQKAREEYGLEEVSVFVSGVGTGREAAIRALNANGLNVTSIKDMTSVPHNGCRPKKPRRV